MAKLRYLESMDSVRSRWDLEDSRRRDDAYAQCFIESLITLAFGLDLVVQQSVALDSYAFQRTLVDLGAAYDRVRNESKGFKNSGPMPVRLHLFNTDTFANSIASNLRRMANGADRPFKSSLYPDISDLKAKRINKMADDFSRYGRSHDFSTVIGSDRDEMLTALLAWFGTADKHDRRRVVEAKPDSRQVALDEAVAVLLKKRSDLMEGLKKRPDLERPSIHQAINALRTLKKEFKKKFPKGSPFGDRSRLHLDSPWIPGGPSALEIVGSVDTLRLVREMINTLYNRVVVQSIGVASASYTTDIGAADQTEDELAIQDLALRAFESAKGYDPWTAEVQHEDGSPLALKVELRGGEAFDNLRQRFGDAQAVDSFAAVLRARHDPTWTKSFIDLDRWSRFESEKKFEEAIDAHVAMLASVLRGACKVERTSTSKVRFTIVSLGTTYATEFIDNLAAEVDLRLAGLFGLATATSVEAIRLLRARQGVRAVKESLGQFVGPSRV
jgi:hypothetical protein